MGGGAVLLPPILVERGRGGEVRGRFALAIAVALFLPFRQGFRHDWGLAWKVICSSRARLVHLGWEMEVETLEGRRDLHLHSLAHIYFFAFMGRAFGLWCSWGFGGGRSKTGWCHGGGLVSFIALDSWS
jgi:hypothetical protein